MPSLLLESTGLLNITDAFWGWLLRSGLVMYLSTEPSAHCVLAGVVPQRKLNDDRSGDWHSNYLLLKGVGKFISLSNRAAALLQVFARVQRFWGQIELNTYAELKGVQMGGQICGVNS